jgi:glutathione-regulated potassium-efflux system ancillary protein KefG
MAPTVRTEDLIDAQGIADLLGLAHRNTVSVYQKRYSDMPRPVMDLGPGRPRLWTRGEITEWAIETGRLKR